MAPNANRGPDHQSSQIPVSRTNSHEAATNPGTTAPRSHTYRFGSRQGQFACCPGAGRALTPLKSN